MDHGRPMLSQIETSPAAGIVIPTIMSTDNDETLETYNPWTIVNLVFTHLAGQGLHPTLGGHGDPGAAAHDLLTTLGVTPAAEGNRAVMVDVHAHLAEIRSAVFEEGK
jgi:hypothetical protein